MKFRLLQADEIDARISSVGKWGVQLLLYKDARCDMNILDETVGPENWQRAHEVVNGNLFCNVGIWVDRRGEGYGDWVWKQDVGVESYTEKEKGEASDSFKRACFNWGIGRELYTAPSMFVYPESLATLKENNGKWTCSDRFTVEDVQYIGRKICYVRIRNEKTKKAIEYGESLQEKETREEISKSTIGELRAGALATLCLEKNINVAEVCKRYGVETLADLTEEQHSKAKAAVEKSSGNNRKN